MAQCKDIYYRLRHISFFPCNADNKRCTKTVQKWLNVKTIITP